MEPINLNDPIEPHKRAEVLLSFADLMIATGEEIREVVGSQERPIPQDPGMIIFNLLLIARLTNIVGPIGVGYGMDKGLTDLDCDLIALQVALTLH